MALAGPGARPPAIVVVKPQPSHFWYVSGGLGHMPTTRTRALRHFGHSCGVGGVGIRGAIPRPLQVRFLAHRPESLESDHRRTAPTVLFRPTGLQFCGAASWVSPRATAQVR